MTLLAGSIFPVAFTSMDMAVPTQAH